MPPLSWTLRDSPRPGVSHDPAAAYSFGVPASLKGSPAAFQSALPPTVLLPESFRGGCSFGAAPPDLTSGRDLSCGRAYGGPCVAPRDGAGQRLGEAVCRGVPILGWLVEPIFGSLPDLPRRVHALVQDPEDLDHLRLDRTIIEDVHRPPDP
jgi:hypothetical protein